MTGSRARDVVRRAVGALTVTALLGAAVATATGLAWPGAAASPAPHPSVRVAPSPGRTIIATPEPSDHSPGITVEATPQPDGSFLVEESVALPAAATQVVLRPPVIDDAGRGFAARRPTATDVSVRAGTESPAGPSGGLHTATTIRWSSPTAAIVLRYRLHDVSVGDPAARADRRVAALGSLVGDLPAELPVMAVVRGPSVLSLTCPQLPLDRLACAAGAPPKFWTAEPIPYDRAQLLVQYDVPAAR